mgnify:FL=1
MNDLELKTRNWETLLSYSEQRRYSAAINQGYFSTYQGPSWKHDTFYGAFIWKHPGRVKVIKRFEELLGHRPDWDDLTTENLKDLCDVIKSNYSPNSANVIVSEIKALIREYEDTKPIPHTKLNSVLKAKTVPCQNIYLTMEEINKIRNYVPKSYMERYVQRLFMLECLTGARISDCKRFTMDNISIYDKREVITYVAQKSKIEIKVPLHRWVRKFFVKGPFEPNDIHLTIYTVNIRNICKKCGIDDMVKLYRKGMEMRLPKYEFVTSHTGRRSFATNMSLMGVSIEQISLMMGHMDKNVPNIMMTNRYICGKLSLDNKVFNVFTKYELGEPVDDYDDSRIPTMFNDDDATGF